MPDFECAEMREQQLPLKDHSDPAFPNWRLEQVATVQQGTPFGFNQSGNRMQHSALAGAVWADHGDHCTRWSSEGCCHTVCNLKISH